MNKELKAYKMAAKIVANSKDKIPFSEALQRTKAYYAKKHFWQNWFSHVGDDYAASIIEKTLMGRKI